MVSIIVSASCLGCGGEADETSVDEACRAAAATFAAAPGPGETAAGHAAFLDAADLAVREATFPIRDLAADSDDLALQELARLLDRFPRLAGRWTIEEIVWRSWASVVRIAEVAAELGEPSCGAETFRLSDWESLAEQLTPPAADGTGYVEALSAVCAESIGSFRRSGEAGELGEVTDAVLADNAVNSFDRGTDDLVPPADLVDRHVSILAALRSVDALTPILGGRWPGATDRLQASFDRIDADMEAMGASC